MIHAEISGREALLAPMAFALAAQVLPPLRIAQFLGFGSFTADKIVIGGFEGGEKAHGLDWGLQVVRSETAT